MRKNLFKPIVSSLDKTLTKHDSESYLSILEVLMEQFSKKAGRGEIKLKNVNDFVRMVNAYVTLSELRNIESDKRKAEESRIKTVISDDDPMVAELYEKIFGEYNKAHDEENK